MLELNIRSRSSSVSIDDLEQYWDSEAPRIGDAHPSHAGIARWLETQAAPSSSVTSLGEAVDPELANLVRMMDTETPDATENTKDGSDPDGINRVATKSPLIRGRHARVMSG